MGTLEMPAELPDVVGLPEYQVKSYRWEIDGANMRVAFCGCRFGHPEWLYTVLMSPAELLTVCAELQKDALLAMQAIQSQLVQSLGERRDAAH